ncbi:MAG: hypothetical protein JWL72_8 [Ilumatobacteraceae bacterium]|nr:hypothetical protein [Ilumatobacteraceae bacterium]MCU1386670.1 hypothetical protein [Ilumatobacteraceae bacterium]
MKPDGWFMHFIRFILIGLVMNIIPLVGLIWGMIALSKTGYRKRDVLMYLIPIWGFVVAIRMGWRYTAKNVYWSPRADRPSGSLFA